MAKFTITGPDGAEYDVTAPDDATDDQVLEYVRAQHASAGAPQPAPEESFADKAIGAAKAVGRAAADTVGGMFPAVRALTAAHDYTKDMSADEKAELATGVARSAGKGATFGLSERAEARVRALGDTTYDEELQKVRDQQDAWEEANPGTALTAELAGGLVVPGGAALKTGQVAARGVQAVAGTGAAARAAAGVAATAAPGAIFGAGSGAGHTEDFTDLPQMAEDTAIGAGTGAVAGPAIAHGASALWGGAKMVGRGARDAGGRIAELLGADASPAATRILADVVEGKGIARAPRVTRDAARRTAADLDNDVANASTPGVADSLAISNGRVAALVEHLGTQRWMPDAPYEGFARRNLEGQTDRVARGVSSELNGGAVDHRALMQRLEDGAGRDHDATYNAIRQGNIGGSSRNMRVALRRVADENPGLIGHAEQAIDEVVADSSVRFTRADAERLLDGDELLSENFHPAIIERLYHNLSKATNEGDGVARGLLAQLQNRLGDTSRGRAMLAVKDNHAATFRNLEAGKAGENIWNSQGATRSRALQTNAGSTPREQAIFRESAAGAAGQKIAGDQGTFTRPQSLVGSAENRRTMDELFNPTATERVQNLVEREGNVHDVSRRMLEARMGGNHGQPDAGFLANALKFGVQWKFTPSVALMGAWQRIMTGITKQRGAAMADIALNQGQQGIARVRDVLTRREAIRAGHSGRLQGFSVGGSALAAALGDRRE